MKSTQQKGESRHSLDLPQAVKLWPTPIAGQCGMTAKTSGREPGKSTHLGMQVLIRSGLYPTPRANEGKDRLQHVPPSRMKDHGKCNLTQAICDRCGAEINPKSSVTYAGMRMRKNDIDDNDYELCVSCAHKLQEWFYGGKEDNDG